MEHLTSSSRIYEGRVINLRVDKVRLDSGRVTVREIVEHRGAAAIVPVLDNHKVVFVRQYRYTVGEYLLEIPAGTLEPTENPEDCAKRELEEETGYRCAEIQKILECYVAPGYSTEKIHFYLATRLTPSNMNLEEDERINVETMPITNAQEMIRRGEIHDAKTVCGILRSAEVLENSRRLAGGP